MPLELVSGERVITSREQLQSNRVGVASRGTATRESDSYKSCWFMRADFEKISATSLHPHSNHNDLVAPDSEDERVSNADSYVGSDIESGLEQETSELPQSQPSRLHRAVRTEVRFFFDDFPSNL
jgi:hypothetical protein